MYLVRRWWPVPVLFAISLAVQKVVFESRYDVSGHAGEHLSGASAPFVAFVLVAILLAVTPGARGQAVVLVACAAWLASTVLVLVGNVRVVDALVRVGLAHTPTSELVQDASIESAHDLANLAPWLGVAAALAMTAALWRYRHVGDRAAIGAAVVSVVVVPWIFPGAGVLVLTFARCRSYQRALQPERTSRQPHSAGSPTRLRDKSA